MFDDDRPLFTQHPEREGDPALGATFGTATDGATVVVVARGELDLATRDSMRVVLTPLEGDVVIDLRSVTFLDSGAIGVLVHTRNRLLGAGGDLRLREPQPFIRRSLQIVGLADWIES